jgi:AcrR family transcriptional regulator
MANNTATRTAKRRPPQRRREEVLDAAAHVFFQKGYDAATTEEIADRLDILKGSLYYYVESKDQLLFEIVREVIDGVLVKQEEAVSAPGTAIERLRGAIVTHIVHLTKNRTRAAILLHEYRALSEPRRRTIREMLDRYTSVINELVVSAQKEGSVRKDVDSMVATMTILGAVNWPYRWYNPRGPLSSAEIAQQMASILIDGLASTKR